MTGPVGPPSISPSPWGLFTETERHLQWRKHFDIPRIAKALSAEESSLASPLGNMKRVCHHNKQSQVRLKKFPVDDENWVEGQPDLPVDPAAFADPTTCGRQRSSNDVDGAADSAGRSLGQSETLKAGQEPHCHTLPATAYEGPAPPSVAPGDSVSIHGGRKAKNSPHPRGNRV